MVKRIILLLIFMLGFFTAGFVSSEPNVSATSKQVIMGDQTINPAMMVGQQSVVLAVGEVPFKVILPVVAKQSGNMARNDNPMTTKKAGVVIIPIIASSLVSQCDALCKSVLAEKSSSFFAG